MNKKQITFIVVAAIILIGGALLSVRNKEKKPISVGTQTETGIQSGQVSVSDTAGWTEYRNSEMGYQFKYPSNWKLEEKEVSAGGWSETHPDWVFRYIALTSQDFRIEIGVKNLSEGDAIKLQSWKTGIPAGDFQTGEIVDVWQGKAQVRRLVYNDGKTEHTQLVWYCNPDSEKSACGEFPIDKTRVASVGIYSIRESLSDPWLEIEQQTQKVIDSLQTF